MLIERIRVENFRTLKGPVELRLGPGLNLIHGSNEAGKSTLVDAVFTALTVKAATTGAIHKEIRPRDGSIASVTVALSHRGATYTIAKRFGGQSGTVRLQIRTAGRVEELSSDDAESRLRTLLGIEYRTANGRGAPTALGLLPLLFVRQGDATLEPSAALGAYGKVSLTSRLAGDAANILEGTRPGLFEPGADRLFERVKRERDRYFNDGNDQWRRMASPAADANAILQRARIEATTLRERARAFEGALDRHAHTREAIVRIQAQVPALAAEAEATAKRLEDVRRLAVLVETQQHAAAACEAELKRLTERAEDRHRQISAGEQARSDAAHVRSALEQLRVRLDAHRAAREGLALRVSTLHAEARELARRAQRAAEHASAQRLDAAVAENVRRVAAARSVASRLAELEAKRAGGLARSDVERMEALERALDRSELALESACAGVRITARKPVEVAIGGERRSMAAGEVVDRRIQSALILEIADLVELAVEPGGAGMSALEQKARTDRAALDQALMAHGCASVTEARWRGAARTEAEIELESAKRELLTIAPEGRDVLERRHAELGERQAAAVARAKALSKPGDEDLPSTVDEATARVEALQQERSAHEGVLAEAERALGEHDLANERMIGDQTALAAELRAVERRIDEHREALERSIAELGDDEDLAAKLVEAQTRNDELRAKVGEWARALGQTDVSAAETEAARAERAQGAALAEVERLRREEAMLCGELQSADLAGLHERLDDAKASEANAATNLARIERDGEAARILYDTICATRDEARRRYLAPLRTELESLLGMLFPGARIVLDEEFAIAQLDRPDQGADTFAGLSFGTREQIAILTRLAFARILAAGEALPVILDDALAGSDPVRAARMANVLFRAAKEMQLIVLTCDPERYRRLGCDEAQVIDLNQIQRVNGEVGTSPDGIVKSSRVERSSERNGRLTS